ncbi:hypothetical protein PAPYR_12073 [Paratrimastix pyriformis]|uniref:Uncharacterized protein n=1 Tax=Paratrimastix pyriformis TaxID=342808 RepID=A0ABQ8U454_9EUKA|nr:hypothetical protein PAPYR_12073 [Paratrimastix pyriformis]
MYVDPDPPEVPPLNPNDHEYPPQKQPHAILDSLPFAFSAPFDIHMYVDPDPPKCLRSTPMTTNTRPNSPQKQPHAILDSLPFCVFLPLSTYICMWTLTLPKCLRSTPMTTNTRPNSPQKQPHAILDSLPFAFSAPFDIHMYVDPDPPEVPPLNPNDHEYPSE